jgi:hypothetical protein
MEDYLLKQGRIDENEIRVTFRFVRLLLSGCFAAGGLIAHPAQGAELASEKLRSLVDRSDLIVVASTAQICEGWRGSGPLADGVHPTPEYREFIFSIKIGRVLKGPAGASSTPIISYTALVYGPKDLPKPIKFDTAFKVEPDGLHVAARGAPHPGVAYIFFLQNRKTREPGSYEAAGKQEIIYNNFDFTSGMIPASHAALAQIQSLPQAG